MHAHYSAYTVDGSTLTAVHTHTRITPYVSQQHRVSLLEQLLVAFDGAELARQLEKAFPPEPVEESLREYVAAALVALGKTTLEVSRVVGSCVLCCFACVCEHLLRGGLSEGGVWLQHWGRWGKQRWR